MCWHAQFWLQSESHDSVRFAGECQSNRYFNSSNGQFGTTFTIQVKVSATAYFRSLLKECEAPKSLAPGVVTP